MNGINLSNIRGLFFGGNTYTKMYYGATLIWPIDYEQQYFTTIARESGDIVFTIPSGVTAYCLRSISYSTDNGSTWTTINNVNNQAVTVTVPVNNGDKVLWKGAANSFYELGNQATFSNTTISFDVQGNIMTLVNGDTFYPEFMEGIEYVFAYLFSGTHVVDASNLILPATILRPYCYFNMFRNCTSLTVAPELPATTLANSCYSQMFWGCTSLTTAPELLAKTLVNNCYSQMFYGCTNLNYITMMATDVSGYAALYLWVYNVAATGTFVKYEDTTLSIGEHGIPRGWIVQNIVDYEHQYFNTVARGSGNIIFTIRAGVTTSDLRSISYSTDNGTTWTTTNNVDNQAVTVTVPVNNGDKVLWKGVGTTMRHDVNNYARFSTLSVSFDVEGNIMSLLNGDNFYQSGFASGSSYNFYNLFVGNPNNAAVVRVVDASNLILPATTLTEACYQGMFSGCTKLTTAPELPATSLANGCYSAMFSECTSLTTAPELPATTLADYCYPNMFSGCTALTTAPELPVTTLAEGCYTGMFIGCTKLTTAPELPATTLANGCYYRMFENCTSLTTAPELPATTLAEQCYYRMFWGCTNLNYIKMLATDVSVYDSLYRWVSGVSATGTFVKYTNTPIQTGDSGIPTGWTVEETGYEAPITIIPKANGTLTITMGANLNTTSLEYIAYSTDGNNWTNITNVNNQTVTGTINMNANNKLYLVGKGKQLATSNSATNSTLISSSVDFDMYGNIMSLLNFPNFKDSVLDSSCTYHFSRLFYGNTHLINIKGLLIPKIKVYGNCFNDTFNGCTGLVSAPNVIEPSNCQDGQDGFFKRMFRGCTSLVNAPALPATVIGSQAYSYMFYGCTALVNAPALPALEIPKQAYDNMFRGCTSLVNAPALPATSFTGTEVYRSMFYGCTALVNAPALPATTLTTNCYGYMFQNCTSLVTAPDLPATTLVSNCYNQMFRGCSNLNYIKMMATNISADACLINWVLNVAASGTFVKKASTTLPTGASGIPSGWTVQNQ